MVVLSCGGLSEAEGDTVETGSEAAELLRLTMIEAIVGLLYINLDLMLGVSGAVVTGVACSELDTAMDLLFINLEPSEAGIDTDKAV